MQKQYKQRVVDAELAWRLETKGAILIEGPKWCGKTTTAAHLAASSIYMQAPEDIERNLELAKIKPSILLSGKTPRLIDEWQLAPTLWDAVRVEVDRRGEMGQFILTGSAVPAASNSHSHTGTGRISRLRMRPMTLTESKDGPGGYSLQKLFAGEQIEPTENPLDIERILFLICRGGWPAAVSLSDRAALQQAIDYVDAVAEADITRTDGVQRDPARVRALLRSYARLIGGQAANTTILSDITGNEKDSLSKDTLGEYLRALEQIFVIEELPAWSPALRSKTTIRSKNTRHFCDPSIAAAALRFGPQDLLQDLETAGLMFESMCVRDLRVYAQCLDGDVYHYRDANGNEVDAIVHLRDGRWGLFEVKLADHRADEAAKSLQKVASIIDQKRLGNPSFLAILTAGKYAYQRPDGVHVIPLPCLEL